MSSLLRKSDQAQLPLVPAWHPNFRNHERLPDTKVVRTQFFINFAAIAVTVSLLLYFSYQEYRIKNLNRQIAEWQTQIDSNKNASNQAHALARKFEEEEKKIHEAQSFVQTKLVLSQFLLHLGATMPKEIALEGVDLHETGVTLRGLAAGTADEASGRTSNYVEQLRQDKYLSGIFADVVQNRLERDQTSGRLMFDLFLRFKGAVAKK